MIAVATWSLAVTPGQTYAYDVHDFAHLRITQAALGHQLEDPSSRSTVIVELEDDEDDEDEDEDADEDERRATKTTVVLTSLTPGKIEQSLHNIEFNPGATLHFKILGKNTIHLAGNLISVDDDGESGIHGGRYFSDDEDGYHLHDDGSDAEIEIDELDGMSTDGDRFEEVDEGVAAKAGVKRLRAAGDNGDEDKSKTDKKANKKLKAQNGAAVPAGADVAPAKEKAEKKDKKEKEKKEKKEKPEVKKKEDKKKEEKPKEAAASNAIRKELPGGLVIEEGKTGTGKAAKKGSTLSMRYIGKLSNGTIFDSNIKGKPFTFKLGAGEVIKGWDQGLLGMQEGSERRLVIPPSLAYGNRKMDIIPANSTLTFEVKLLSVK